MAVQKENASCFSAVVYSSGSCSEAVCPLTKLLARPPGACGSCMYGLHCIPPGGEREWKLEFGKGPIFPFTTQKYKD